MSGTQLDGANFQDADLSDVKGLRSEQLAWTNLAGAKLPEAVARFEGLGHIENMSQNANKLFALLVVGWLSVWLAVFTTTDSSLLLGSALWSLPLVETKIPLGGFYLVSPLILLAIYIYFHIHLQHLWKEIADLPAIFPDGKPADEKIYPWLLNGFASSHIGKLPRDRSLLHIMEGAIAVVFGWWIVPWVLCLIWLRYLPRHNFLVTGFHVLELSFGIVLAVWFLQLASSTLARKKQPPSRRILLITLALVLVLGCVVSYGAINGEREEREQAILLSFERQTDDGLGAILASIRRTVPKLLEALPVHAQAFADLQEPSGFSSPAALGTRSDWPPPTSSESEDNEKSSRGATRAELSRADLRYASAKRALLKKANLKSSDLRGVNLVDAQLQNADLREARLQKAYLFKARLNEATLDGAHLEGAYLSDAELKNASMRYADLREAILVGAHLENADLTGANLEGARLSGAHLDGTRLFRARLKGTVLDSADLETAKGLEQAQVNEACISHQRPRLASGINPPTHPCSGSATHAPLEPKCDAAPCTITLASNALSTLAASVGPAGKIPDEYLTMLEKVHDDLEFRNVASGRYFTSTAIPAGAPGETEVVNIPPGDGRSGYFKVSFVAPKNFSRVELVGKANVDDVGEVFLNRYHISTEVIKQFGDASFSTNNLDLFRRGSVNELLIAAANIGGGPSGAAFYITITFH